MYIFDYRRTGDKFICVVGKHLNGEGFIITKGYGKREDMEKKLILIHNKRWKPLTSGLMILREVICEEVGEGIILKKDENGKVIGIEVLYFPNEDIPLEFKAIAKTVRT